MVGEKIINCRALVEAAGPRFKNLSPITDIVPTHRFSSRMVSSAGQPAWDATRGNNIVTYNNINKYIAPDLMGVGGMQGHDESAPVGSRSDPVLISLFFCPGKEKGGKEDDLRSDCGVSYILKEI